MLANMIASPLAAPSGASKRVSYIAFDLDPARVKASRKAGFSVVYGDGSRTNVLHAAGVGRPRAVAVCYSDVHRNKSAVELVAAQFPGVPIYACAADFRCAWGRLGFTSLALGEARGCPGFLAGRPAAAPGRAQRTPPRLPTRSAHRAPRVPPLALNVTSNLPPAGRRRR